MDLKMEVYTPLLELVGILEVHRSVIWEEKAFEAGSFSVDALITPESVSLLSPYNIIWIEGETAGIIEYVQEHHEKDGPYITVKGPVLTGILGYNILHGLYNLTGTAPSIMHRLVYDCCISPTRGDVESRKIPVLVSLTPAAGGDAIRAQKTGGTLLEALEELGAAYGVAFGVRFNPAVPQMEFWTRWGQNRGINQDVNDPVFYSTELDDVLSSEYSYNAQDYRNVALVAGEGDGSDRVMVTVNADVSPTPIPPIPETKYTITLSVDPQGGGVASGGGQVNEGQSVTVSATPADGYTFSGWRESGEIVSTSASYTFTVSADRSLTAVFAVVVPTYTITATIDPTGSGTVTGVGQYQEGATVTLTAVPADGYKFSGWQENGQTVSADTTYTFTVTGNRTLVTVFAMASRLPDGYTELEYISTDVYTRIPTGIRATIDTTRVVMDIAPIEHKNVRSYFFDAVNVSSPYYTLWYGLRNNETDGNMLWASGYYGNSSSGYGSFNYSFDYESRITIDMDCPSKKLKIGNTIISISPAETTSMKDAGDLNFGGYYPSINDAFTQRMSIYSAQVYLAGVLKGDFIPCVKDDGTIGMYNLVNDTFYGASHGTLTPGPAV